MTEIRWTDVSTGAVVVVASAAAHHIATLCVGAALCCRCAHYRMCTPPIIGKPVTVSACALFLIFFFNILYLTSPPHPKGGGGTHLTHTIKQQGTHVVRHTQRTLFLFSSLYILKRFFYQKRLSFLFTFSFFSFFFNPSLVG